MIDRLRVENLDKPDNKKWKLVANILIYALIPELGIIMTLPIPDAWKLWLTFAIAELSLFGKLISKFTSDDKG
jgi:hypothetical protein